MKRIIYLLIAFLLTACFEEEVFKIATDKGVRVIASIPSTRTTFIEDNNVTHVAWDKGDVIGICTNKQYNLAFSAEASSVETDFKSINEQLQVAEGDSVYAYYPKLYGFSENDDFVVRIQGNSTQDYSINNGSFDVLYAKGVVQNNQVSLQFKHLYAFLKITMPTKLVKPQDKASWIEITSTEKIGVNQENTFNLRNGELSGLVDNVMYYIPDTVSTDEITCYIAILPQSENAVLGIGLLGYALDVRLLTKRAPTGGFLAGNVYTIDLENEIKTTKAIEREALIALYNAAGGKDWINQDNWCSDKPVSEWTGVEVNEIGMVIALYGSGNSYNGYIPKEIANLKYLRNLAIGGGGKLDVEESFKSISTLSNLRSLSIDYTPLDMDISTIDFSALKNLEHFSAIRSQLYGKLPESMKQLTKIREICISDNRNVKEDGNYYGIDGEIASFFPYWPYLERFEASSCMLRGPLPEISVEQGKNLKTFFVDDNALTGSIPESHVRILDNMVVIQNDSNFGWNRFGYNISNNLLSGQIPEVILNHETFPIYLYQIMLQNYEPYVFDKTDIPWWTYKLKSTDGVEYDFGEIFKSNKFTILWNLGEEGTTMDDDSMKWPKKMEELMNLYGDKGLDIYVNQSFVMTDSRMKEIMSYMPSVKLICVDNGENNPYYKENNPYYKVSSYLFPNNYFFCCGDGSAYGQFYIIDSSAHLIYCGYGGGPSMKYLHGYPETNEDIFEFVKNLFGD